MTQTERAKRINSIRYQVDTPRVTTMGACRKGCGRSARGGQTCADCLTDRDPYLVAFVAQLREHVRARWAAE